MRLSVLERAAPVILGGDPIRDRLRNVCRAYYRFENGGGDSSGYANTLTEVNSVSYASGKVGSAAQLAVASSQHFTRVGMAGIGNLTAFSVSVWVYLASKGANRIAVKMVDPDDTTKTIWNIVFLNASDRYRVSAMNAAGAQTNVDTNTYGSPATAAWTHIAARADGAGTLGVSVNGGAFDTGALASHWQEATPTLFAGSNETPASFWDGAIDELALFPSALSDAEFAWLYNAGAGRSLFQ